MSSATAAAAATTDEPTQQSRWRGTSKQPTRNWQLRIILVGRSPKQPLSNGARIRLGGRRRWKPKQQQQSTAATATELSATSRVQQQQQSVSATTAESISAATESVRATTTTATATATESLRGGESLQSATRRRVAAPAAARHSRLSQAQIPTARQAGGRRRRKCSVVQAARHKRQQTSRGIKVVVGPLRDRAASTRPQGRQQQRRRRWRIAGRTETLRQRLGGKD